MQWQYRQWIKKKKQFYLHADYCPHHCCYRNILAAEHFSLPQVYINLGNLRTEPFFLIYGSRQFSFHSTCLRISHLVIVFTKFKYTFPSPVIELTITVTKFINQRFTPPGYCPVDEDNSPNVNRVNNNNFSSQKFRQKFKEKCCSLPWQHNAADIKKKKQEKILELHWSIIPHLPHSPDLTLTKLFTWPCTNQIINFFNPCKNLW